MAILAVDVDHLEINHFDTVFNDDGDDILYRLSHKRICSFKLIFHKYISFYAVRQ